MRNGFDHLDDAKAIRELAKLVQIHMLDSSNVYPVVMGLRAQGIEPPAAAIKAASMVRDWQLANPGDCFHTRELFISLMTTAQAIQDAVEAGLKIPSGDSDT